MKKINFDKIKRGVKGITLVALVVTIIVLLILAGVAINLTIGTNGIFTRAQNAVDKYETASKDEQEELDKAANFLDEYINKGKVNNPYDSEGWKYAWVCKNGVWDNTQYQAGAKLEGDIIAKFYAMENTITPSELNFNGNTIKFPEGTEYHLVIEGTGKMGSLMLTEGNDIKSASAWQFLSAQYYMDYIKNGSSDLQCIIPYVTEISVCDGINNIGSYAFSGDTELTKVNISDSVTNIGSYVFGDCSNLPSITIPSSVTSIGDAAFFMCTNLENITIPSSVTSIGNYAFEKCENLEAITLSKKIKSIEKGTFLDCTNLKSVTIPTTITKIGVSAFQNCTKLTSITILSGKDEITIEDSAFYDCTNLESIYIPKNVTSIGNGVFGNCNNLTINYEGSESEWNNLIKDTSWNTGSSITINYNQLQRTNNY